MSTVPSGGTIAAGFDALTKNEYPAARAAFERALSEGGGDEALIHLGWLLEQGLGGQADVSRAKSLYRQALEKEPGLAAYHLGLLLMKEGHREEGSELLDRAAQLGNPSAAYWLYAFSSDAADPQSAALAEKSLLRAAELGHIYARRDIERRRIRTSRGLAGKLSALLAYWKTKVVGIALTIRNVNDWRVR
jgi:TPR repeat protein